MLLSGIVWVYPVHGQGFWPLQSFFILPGDKELIVVGTTGGTSYSHLSLNGREGISP